MRTLNISIPDTDYAKLGLKSEKLSYAEFRRIVSNELARQNLDDAVALAERFGLSSMTMDEITGDVKDERSQKRIRFENAFGAFESPESAEELAAFIRNNRSAEGLVEGL